MSYKQECRWYKKHRKGHKVDLGFSTGSGFWASGAWLEGNYMPYVEACKLIGVEPLDTEQFYRRTIKGVKGFQRHPSDYAAMTKAGTLT